MRPGREAFNTPDFNVLIAANKYQTGFDQPKLCAMYVDKKLQGVDCVQTLSRLNRIFEGKQTFILDFFNEPQDILEAFLPYYTKAELSDVTDPQIIYDLQKKLDAEGIYYWQEVEAFALAFFDSKSAASKLSYYCTPARERFARRYVFSLESRRQQALSLKHSTEANGDSAGLKKAEHALKEAGEQIDQLDLFRKNLQSFVRLYEFLSQIVAYEDRELEQLCVYAKNLHPLLRTDRLQKAVDIGELQLTHYCLSKRAEQQLRLGEAEGEYGLKPGRDIGSDKPHDPEKKRLSEIIEALNEIFGAEISDEDQLQFLTGIAQRISRQEDVMAQVKHHSVEQVMHGLFPKRVLDTVLDNTTKSNAFARAILKMLTQQAGGVGQPAP